MAIDFNNTDDIRRIQRLIENPTGWGTRVINTINNALGVLGNASQRDTGTAGGEIPLVENIGEVLPKATGQEHGVETLGIIPPIQSVFAESQLLRDIFLASNITIRQIFIRDVVNGLDVSNNFFRFSLSRNPSLLLISTASQSADGSVNEGMDDYIVLSSDNSANATRIILNNGQAQERLNPQGTTAARLYPLGSPRTRSDNETEGIYFLTQAQLDAFNFHFGFVLPEWGTQGGAHQLPTDRGQVAFNSRNRTVGVAGDLLVAYKPASALFYTTATTAADGRYTNPLYFAFRNESGAVVGKSAWVIEIPL